MFELIGEFVSAESNQLIVLFLVIAAGVLLGRIEIKGVSLGSSGVLFSAIFFGHLGATLPSFIGTVGVVLFVYAIGLQAGPRFFKTFRSQGLSFAILALATLFAGLVTAFLTGRLLGLDPGMTAGLYTGALTTTPGLAAAIEAVDPSQDPGWAAAVSVGYGIAYPFGVAGVVLFVQLFPRVLKLDLKQLASEEESAARSGLPKGSWYEVRNPQLAGLTIAQFTSRHFADAAITRIENPHGEVRVATEEAVIELKARMWVVARPEDEERLATVIGPRVSTDPPRQDDGDRILVRDVFVTEEKVAGKTLGALNVRESYGVVVSRLWREEIEFVPQADSRLEIGDTIRIVGAPEAVERFAEKVGNVEKKLQETNFLPLCAGIAAGAWIGSQSFTLPGAGFPIKLGMAGGPLFVALIAGHFGRIGTMSIRMPAAAKIFIRELGLMFFLAGAGIRAGADFWDVLQQNGLPLFIAGFLITVVPMIAAWVVARNMFRLGVLPSLGAICGGMTSTPALGALTQACDSQTPALAYATVYPVALIVVTIFAQLLAKLLFLFMPAMT